MKIGNMVLLLVASLPTTAYAQHPLVLERLQALDKATPPPSAAFISAEIMKTATLAHKSHGGCLPNAVAIESISSATSVPFVFASAVRGTTKNAWTITATHANCGTDVVRYTMVQQADGGFDTIRTNRGRSYANESLIGDTFPLAALAASTSLKRRANVSCDASSATLGIIRLAQQDADLGPEVYGVRYKGSWSEIWPMTMCGRTVEVFVKFTADGDGGAFQNIKEENSKVMPLQK